MITSLAAKMQYEAIREAGTYGGGLADFIEENYPRFSVSNRTDTRATFRNGRITEMPAEMSNEEKEEAWAEYQERNRPQMTDEERYRNEDQRLFSKSPSEIAEEEETKRQFKANIKPLLRESKKQKHKNNSTSFGKAKPWLVVVSRRNGLEINGFKHSVDVDSLVHINDWHGKGNETNSLQIPVTDEDIENIPDIVNTPDYLVYGLKSDRNLDTIGYLKTFPDGTTYYVEEIKNRAGELAAKTMFRIEGRSSENLVEESLHHTSETSPSAVKLVNTLKRATIIPAFTKNIASGITDVNNKLFSKAETVRGTYNPERRLIELFADRKPETVLHEVSHYFFQNYFAVADKYGYSDYDRGMLRWLSKQGKHEIKSLNDMETQDWENLTETFLRYLNTGNAPTIATRGVFQKAKEWVLDVFEINRDIASNEVKDFFDSLVAREGKMPKPQTEGGETRVLADSSFNVEGELNQLPQDLIFSEQNNAEIELLAELQKNNAGKNLQGKDFDSFVENQLAEKEKQRINEIDIYDAEDFLETSLEEANQEIEDDPEINSFNRDNPFSEEEFIEYARNRMREGVDDYVQETRNTMDSQEWERYREEFSNSRDREIFFDGYQNLVKSILENNGFYVHEEKSRVSDSRYLEVYESEDSFKKGEDPLQQIRISDHTTHKFYGNYLNLDTNQDIKTEIQKLVDNIGNNTLYQGTWDAGNDNIYYQTGKNDRDLVVQHATTLEKLSAALELGAMPMPSLAVTKSEYAGDSNFGEIVFIGGSDVIDPAKNRDNHTFPADIYSTRKISPVHEINQDGREYLERLTSAMSQKGLHYWVENVKQNLDDGNDSVLKALFLASKSKITDLDGSTYMRILDMSEQEKSDFAKWKRKFVAEYTDKKIFEGFTPSGRRRFSPYDLNNILRLMKKENLKASESTADGNAHALRGVWAEELKSIEEIRQAKGKIVDAETYKNLDNVIWDETNKLSYLLVTEQKAEELERSWVAPDKYMIEEVLKKLKSNSNIKAALEKAELRSDKKAVDAVKRYMELLKATPVQYFESKPQRAVDFSEFAGVIMPTSQEYDSVADTMAEYGLQVVRSDDKRAAVKEFEDIFFQGRISENVENMPSIEDFRNPNKDYELPRLNPSDLFKLGKEDKPVILKKNIIEKNKNNHPEVDISEYGKILTDTLVDTSEIIQAQPQKKPNYYTFINDNQNDVSVVELSENKDNYEVINFFKVNKRRIDEYRKKAVKDGGDVIITERKPQGAARLSALLNNSNNSITPKEENVKLDYQNKPQPKGLYDANKGVIKIFESADFSTLPHELAHYWLDNMWRYVRSGNASEKYR